jgi:Flp pilus assembly pilin Flp
MRTFNLFVTKLYSRMQREEGQSLVEWALILALVTVVAIAILGTIGTNVVAKLTQISTSL